jgi:hypothetical protein
MPPKKKPRPPIEEKLSQLRELFEEILDCASLESGLAQKKYRLDIEDSVRGIQEAIKALDPIRLPESFFDPTVPATAGRIIALSLMAQSRHSLSQIPSFYGSGVYAIHYKGQFGPYSPLSGTEHPIYVGKADPDSSAAKDPCAQGTKLSKRLQEHAKNIGRAENLSLDDFECRFLVVQTGFQAAAENYLIDFFKPVWNRETNMCHGLGKHGDSAETRSNARSPWDTLHPGRSWAANSTSDQIPEAEILQKLENHFSSRKIYRNFEEIFEHFILDLRQVNA